MNAPVNRFWSVVLSGLVLLGGAAHGAGASLPGRDLTVELRQTEEGRDAGSRYSAGSAESPLWEPQRVQVRNGEKALLRLNAAVPMQWTQSVSGLAPGQAGNSAGASAGTATNVNINAAAGVGNALVWFDTGQSLSVRPKWPGGNKPALVEIEVQRAAPGARTEAGLPGQTRNSLATTVTVPLAEWVTIAVSGEAAKAGVYSSAAALQARQLLQIRVMAP